MRGSSRGRTDLVNDILYRGSDTAAAALGLRCLVVRSIPQSLHDVVLGGTVVRSEPTLSEGFYIVWKICGCPLSTTYALGLI